MSCERCADSLPSAVSITTPKEFWEAVAWIRAEISAGRMTSAPDSAGGTRFEDWNPDSGWPDDYILYRFHCAGCGDAFELSCETYHGCGGQLSRVG